MSLNCFFPSELSATGAKRGVRSLNMKKCTFSTIHLGPAGLGLVMIIMTMMMMRITTKIMMMTMLLVEMKKNRYDKNGDANEYYDVT